MPMEHKRVNKRVSDPTPSTADVPKLPYYAELRREQKVEFGELKDGIGVHPEPMHKLIDNTVQRSLNYPLKWDGHKWIKDTIDIKQTPLKAKVTVSLMGPDESVSITVGAKDINGVVEYLCLYTDDKDCELKITLDDVAFLIPPQPIAEPLDYSPARLFQIGGEDNLLKLSQYNTIDDDFFILNKRDLYYADGCTITLHNPTLADINTYICIYYRAGA